MNTHRRQILGFALGFALILSLIQPVAHAAPTVSLQSAPSVAVVGQAITAKGLVSTRTAGVPVSTQVLIGGTWSTSQTGRTTADGRFELPLTYGTNSPGNHVFRLTATVDGVTVTSPQFTITRIAAKVTLMAAPSTATVGAQVIAKGATSPARSGTAVSTEVFVGGSWRTSQRTTTDASGRFQLPLSYGQSQAGTVTYRLTATFSGVKVVSPSYKLLRQASPSAPTIPDSQYNRRRGPNTTNRVILTFDDCPTSLSAFKATVLAAEQADIGLALFPTGDCLRSGRFDASFARAHGHHVFNHSVTHRQLTSLSYEGVRRELSAPGVVTTYGRPPYGAFNSTVARAYASKGMRIWLWNVDTNDWQGRSQSQIVSYVNRTASAGDTVLMHMQHKAFNGSALRSMKSGLGARGIQVCRNYVGTAPAAPPSMWC